VGWVPHRRASVDEHHVASHATLHGILDDIQN
jgi:hypothetical protein